MNFAKFSATAARPFLVDKPPSDPTLIRFRAEGDAAGVGAIDAKAGRIAGVSLLTADREATGWGVWVDGKTLDTFAALLKDRRLKAYATHGMWGRDGTLDEVGFWTAARIDGAHLRADFESLAAWRKHEPADFEKLFELAEKLSAEFGASLSFRYRAVWVRTSGEEIETVRKWRFLPGEGYEEYWEPAMPADAVRDMPSVRARAVYSADFVDVPAANDGLFREGASRPAVDGRGNGDSPPSGASTQSASFAMIKEIYAKFSAQPALLSRAVALHTENDKLTFAEIVAKVEGEQTAAELAQLRGIRGLVEKIEAAGFKAAGDKSAVDVLLAEHAAFKAKATAHDAAQAALKAAGFEDKDGKSATDLALAANAKAKADIATLRAGGSPAVETGSGNPEGAGKTDASKFAGRRRAGAAWNQKFAAQKVGSN